MTTSAASAVRLWAFAILQVIIRHDKQGKYNRYTCTLLPQLLHNDKKLANGWRQTPGPSSQHTVHTYIVHTLDITEIEH